MADCPFCGRIERGEFDAGDEWAVTFAPLRPVAAGHRLFVPRLHVADALEVPAVTGRVAEFAAVWAEARGVWPCNLITSCGRAATQSVFHLHWHLVDRHEDDGLALPWTGQAQREGRAT